MSTHGMYGTPTYRSWASMIQRCTNPNHVRYANYGGRGITVCDRWRTFENFLADMGKRPDAMTLDRIDSTGNYEPGNCRWASPSEQNRNRRLPSRRRDHCPHDHPYTEENTYQRKDGGRQCRTCVLARAKASYNAQKASV